MLLTAPKHLYSVVLQQNFTNMSLKAMRFFSEKLVRHDMEEFRARAESINNIVDNSAEFHGQIGEEKGFVVDGTVAETSQQAAPYGESSEDEEDLEKQNASIGKKLWTFFTT